MPINPRRINLGSVIFHSVPSGPNDDVNPFHLSGVESPLGTEARNYFQQKLTATLTNGAYPVVFDEQSTSMVPGLVLNITTPGYSHFVGDSQIMAHHLRDVQTKNNAPGTLAVAEVDAGDQRAVAIVKLEHEEGARAHQVDHQGELTINIEHLQDLMLTGKTRVFKAALFVQYGTATSDIEGLVSDNQNRRGLSSGVAAFFLKTFLGCQLQVDPSTVTRDFLESAQEWINTEVPDPGKKAGYMIALLAEIASNDETVDPKSFADSHLELDDNQSFMDFVESRDVPTSAFPKDTSLVASQLKKVSITTDSGLAVIGTTDALEENAKIDSTIDGRVQISIVDRLTNVKGRG